jgi:hypothetical protein
MQRKNEAKPSRTAFARGWITMLRPVLTFLSRGRALISSRDAPKAWKRPFDEPVPLPRGRQLITLEGCRVVGALTPTLGKGCARPATMPAAVLKWEWFPIVPYPGDSASAGRPSGSKRAFLPGRYIPQFPGELRFPDAVA